MRPRYAIALGLVATAVTLVVLGTLALLGVLGDDSERARPGGAVAQSGEEGNDVVEGVRPGLVQVVARRGSRREPGAGFAIDERGRIITALANVSGARRLTIRAEGSEGELPAELVGADRSSGLALLAPRREDAAGLEPLQQADMRRVRLGDPVLAVGAPFALGASVSAGVVSGLNRSARLPGGRAVDGLVETDAAVGRGNLGGPLVDPDGRVVGVSVAVGSGQRAYAVPADTAYGAAALIRRERGSLRAAPLGLVSAPVDPGLASTLGLSVEHGLLVTAVAPGGPAAAAGVRPARRDGSGGDVITSVAGRPVRRPRDLVTSLLEERQGRRVELELTRGRRRVTLELRLER